MRIRIPNTVLFCRCAVTMTSWEWCLRIRWPTLSSVMSRRSSRQIHNTVLGLQWGMLFCRCAVTMTSWKWCWPMRWPTLSSVMSRRNSRQIHNHIGTRVGMLFCRCAIMMTSWEWCRPMRWPTLSSVMSRRNSRQIHNHILGYVVLQVCSNDDQLGVVLAHEMAHAVLGHVQEKLTLDPQHCTRVCCFVGVQ